LEEWGYVKGYKPTDLAAFKTVSGNQVTADASGRHQRQSVTSGFAVQPRSVEPLVYVVLLNWNGWQDTLHCISSLFGTEYQNWCALVVDNGSTDDSVARLKETCPQVPIIETHKNLGFAVGNNLGIHFALKNGADYVFVLNNDTTVMPNTISAFVAFAEQHPRTALMGPAIDRRNPQREWPIRRKLDLVTQICTFSALRRVVSRTPIVRNVFYWTGREPAEVEFVSGSALFFRASAFASAGLFDESTFLDFEELIMAEKVRRAGHSIHFVPQAKIWHKGSASGAKLRAQRYIENAKSEEYFFSNYVRLSPISRSIVRLIRLLTYSARALRYRNYREHFREFVLALHASRSLPERH
jgi:GT2 family glycosyltransferase